MKIDNFFAELKRRNVYKVAVAYAVASWLLIQIATQVFPFFEIPNWAVRLVVLLLIAGFPVALVFSWAFEITPEGIKRESEIEGDRSITHHTGRKIIWITVVLAIVAAALLAFQFYGPKFGGAAKNEAPAIPQKSIAVLPFDNLSEDKSNAYFAEGVQDEILTRLAKVADLKVISRTSTQHFKSTPEDLPAIAKQLGVAHILEGSVQKSNDQVRVNVQLINAMTDAFGVVQQHVFEAVISRARQHKDDICIGLRQSSNLDVSGMRVRLSRKCPSREYGSTEPFLIRGTR